MKIGKLFTLSCVCILGLEGCHKERHPASQPVESYHAYPFYVPASNSSVAINAFSFSELSQGFELHYTIDEDPHEFLVGQRKYMSQHGFKMLASDLLYGTPAVDDWQEAQGDPGHTFYSVNTYWIDKGGNIMLFSPSTDSLSKGVISVGQSYRPARVVRPWVERYAKHCPLPVFDSTSRPDTQPSSQQAD